MKPDAFFSFFQTYILLRRSIAWLGFTLLGSTLVFGQPANDSFAARTPIIGSEILISGSLAGATGESGEPLIQGVGTGQTAWWTWTAPSNGIATLLWITGSGFKPAVAMYTGGNYGSLSLVASNNYLACYGNTNCNCHWRVRDALTFHVSAGQAYQIAVDAAMTTDAEWGFWKVSDTNNLPPGAFLISGPQGVEWYYSGAKFSTNMPIAAGFSMDLELAGSPANDNFEGRTLLSGSRTYVYAQNFGAGKEVGEPDHQSNPGGSSVWFSWKAPATGRVTISVNEIPPYEPPTTWADNTLLRGIYPVNLCGSLIEAHPLPSFFPVFAVYTGSSLESLASGNALPIGLDAYPHGVEFDAVEGQTYQIAMDGNMGTTGVTPLYLALTKPTVNDSFARRIQLHGAYAEAKGYNAGATRQVGEPITASNSVGKTVWWSWRAPVSGYVTIDLSGSDYTFPVAVYTGSKLANLREIAVSTGAVAFRAIEGKIYQIAVSDSAGLTGLIKMSIRAPIVEARLIQVLNSGKITALRYAASSGQVLFLLRSSDGARWQGVNAMVAHGDSVSFVVRPPPTATGPFYRAIIIDRAF